MTINSPDAVVVVVPDQDIRLKVNGCTYFYPAGQKAAIPKSVYWQCKDAVVVDGAKSCPDQRWLVTIPADSTYRTEVPVVEGTPRRVAIKTTSALTLATGTASAPLVLPEGEETKEAAPTLIDAGTTTVTLSTDDGDINALALVNCTHSKATVELTWQGCA